MHTVRNTTKTKPTEENCWLFFFFSNPQTEASRLIKHFIIKAFLWDQWTIPKLLCALSIEIKMSGKGTFEECYFMNRTFYVLFSVEKPWKNFQCWDLSLKGYFCLIGYRLVTMAHEHTEKSRSKLWLSGG